MRYPRSEEYDKNFILENMMGPNSMKLAEEMLELQPIPSGSTVLDLGCGRGISSILMVRDYGLKVFAADLWVAPTENKKRFDDMGLDAEQIIPIRVEAHDMPFAEAFFDAVVSIDSYHYFGCDQDYLAKHLLPFVKPGGYILIAVPGLKKDIHDNLPPEMLLTWSAEDLETFHDIRFWTELIETTEGVDIVTVCELQGFDECWNDWLASDNEHAVADRKPMEAGAGRHMNFVGMVLKKCLK